QFPPDSPPRAVNPGEMHFARQRTRLEQTRAAHDLLPRLHPSPPFLLSQQLAPDFRDDAHDLPRQPLRRCPGIAGNDVPAPVLVPASSEEDDRVTPPAFGYIE